MQNPNAYKGDGRSREKLAVDSAVEQHRRTHALEKYKTNPRIDEKSTTSGVTSRSDDGSGSAAADTVLDETQQFGLLNIAYKQQRPKKERPAFRFLGFKETKADIIHHAKTQVHPVDPHCALHLAEAGKVVLICTTLERQQDLKYISEKVQLLQDLHAQDTKRRDEEFQENIKNKSQGQTGTSINKQLENTKKKKGKGKGKNKIKNFNIRQRALKASRVKPKKISNPLMKGKDFSAQINKALRVNDLPPTAEMRKQKVVVITVIPDITLEVLKGNADPEPGIIFWRSFDTYDAAHEWTTTKGKKYIRNYPLDIVDCYEWIFPADVDIEKLNEGFRNPEQERIMNQRKKEKDKVSDFEEWCARENRPVPVTEVVAGQENNMDTKEQSSTATENERAKWDLPTEEEMAEIRKNAMSLPENPQGANVRSSNDGGGGGGDGNGRDTTYHRPLDF